MWLIHWQKKIERPVTYVYGFNNPINVIDPDGMEGQWIPRIVNGKLTAIAEEGNNAQTLQKFLNVSQKQADEEYEKMKDGKITLSDDIPGVSSINSAANHYLKNPDDYGKDGFWTFLTSNYNCYESAFSTSKNETPHFFEPRTPNDEDFENEIKTSNFKDVTSKPKEHTFGKTIMSFNEKKFSLFDGAYESPIHAAIYLGTSKNGTNHRFHLGHVCVLTIVILLLNYKNKYTWGLLLTICLYGLYNITIRQPIYSLPTMMNLTGDLHSWLSVAPSFFIKRLLLNALWLMPLILYLVILALIITNPTRKTYWIHKQI